MIELLMKNASASKASDGSGGLIFFPTPHGTRRGPAPSRPRKLPKPTMVSGADLRRGGAAIIKKGASVHNAIVGPGAVIEEKEKVNTDSNAIILVS